MDMKRKEKGSMGIGALIIFIALVLVAAISAAVIIQTANRIRDEAELTSERITQQFLGMFDIISIYGDRDPDGNGVLSANVEVMTITTKVIASSEVDLRHIAITLKTETKAARLLLSPNVATTDDTYAEALPKATSTEYSVYVPNRAPGSPWDPTNGSYAVGTNDIVVFVIDLRGGGEGTGQPLSAHTEFTLYFSNTYTGAESKFTATTPSGYLNDEQWIRIYPPE